MTRSELHNSIAELAKMDVDLIKKGSPEKSGKLFEKILVMQQELLNEFGLPNTPYYQELLQFDSIPWDKEIDNLITLLYSENEKKKNIYPKSDLELLMEAKKTNRDPMFILPQLGITPHVYTLFIYNNVLMYGQDSLENILNELKFVNNSGLLGTIGEMEGKTEWLENAEEKIKSLENKGLRYIRAYTMNIINYLKSMGFKINGF